MLQQDAAKRPHLKEIIAYSEKCRVKYTSLQHRQ
jgi:hypothetical protein